MTAVRELEWTTQGTRQCAQMPYRPEIRPTSSSGRIWIRKERRQPLIETDRVASAYSVRSARIGSIRLARCAGISPAAAETTARKIIVHAATVGSEPWIPYSWFET